MIRHNSFKCNFYKWKITPSSFLQGTRCPKCSHELGAKKQRKTQEQFEKELYKLYHNEYIVVGKYVNSNTKILIRHNNKNCKYHEWLVYPYIILSGHGCPICNIGSSAKTTNEFKQEIYNLVNDEYTVLGNFKNVSTKIKMRYNCKKCNYYEYEVIPSSFFKGGRCPKCFGNIKKTTHQFQEEVYNLVNNEYILLDKYKGSKTKLKFRHIKCGEEFYMSPHDFLSGRRCPICNESKGERKINNYLTVHNIPFYSQYEFNGLIGLAGKNLKFDFIIFTDTSKNKLKYLIEYDGEFHYKPIKNYKNEPIKFAEERLRKQQEHDKRKNKYCEEHSIRLIRIPYWEFDNIESILENILINNNLNNKFLMQVKNS